MCHVVCESVIVCVTRATFEFVYVYKRSRVTHMDQSCHVYTAEQSMDDEISQKKHLAPCVLQWFVWRCVAVCCSDLQYEEIGIQIHLSVKR